MAAVFAGIRFFAADGHPGNYVQMAANDVAEAMQAQGHELAKLRNNVAVGVTNASPTVTLADAVAGDVGDLMFDAEEKQAYRITAFNLNTDWTLDRDYEGVTDAATNAHTIAGPAAGIPNINPEQVVLGES